MLTPHLESFSATQGEAGHTSNIRWSAIIAGSFVTLALWAMLYSLGASLGLSAVAQDNTTSLKASGIFTGAWSVLSPLVALFVGAMFTSRGAAAHTRGIGAMHGLVMWSLSTLGFAWLFCTLLSSVIGGAMGMTTQILSWGGQSIAASTRGADALQGVAAQAMDAARDSAGIDTQDILQGINTRLKAAGRAPVEPEMLSRALKELVKNGLREGRIDRESIVQVVLKNTPLERQDADAISEQLQSRIESSKEAMQAALAQTKDVAQQTAYKAADVTGKAFWGIFTVLFLGLLASVGGGALGVRVGRHEL